MNSKENRLALPHPPQHMKFGWKWLVLISIVWALAAPMYEVAYAQDRVNEIRSSCSSSYKGYGSARYFSVNQIRSEISIQAECQYNIYQFFMSPKKLIATLLGHGPGSKITLLL